MTPVKQQSRGPSGKSVLETVRENSNDEIKEESPAAVQAVADLKPSTKATDNEISPSKRENGTNGGEPMGHVVESGSESAGTKSPRKKEEQSQRPRNTQTKSYASLASTKSRQQEGKQNMTVETETVPSIPQSALNVGDRSGAGRGENSGSIKQKPSSETIRPKKERKKTTQKARSINQGTGMFYVPTSPLLTSQTPVEDDGNVSSASSLLSSTVREATSSGANSPLPKRRNSTPRRLRPRLSLPNPTQIFRTLSDRFIRKASSKADIFEQRVANAVDEANSSESDEHFVYESNPIEAPRRPRHHSRTPSAASSHSVAEQQRAGIRNVGDALDERRVAGKRSMKFSNNAYNDLDTPDGKDGSVRSHTPGHFGRFGRGGSQQSMFDPDSPFTQASKTRSNQLSARNSRPNSPRSPHNLHQQRQKASGLFGRNKEPSYDFDAEAGDDERTPLVGTVRTSRGARLNQRINRSPSIDEYYNVRRRSRCGRYGGCCLCLVVLILLVCSTAVFLAISNRPLYEVQILQIENVLASEEALMLDLWVSAVNPNALGVTVGDMDLNIFAKSKHVGKGGSVAPITTSRWLSKRKWRKRSTPPTLSWTGDIDLSEYWRAPTAAGGVDEGTNPPNDDLDRDAQTMLLGRVHHFDQALTFEGSPWKRHAHNSTGELRVDKPGNKTETGGSERWERVLQSEFELIVRGTLKYQLPISGRLQTVAVKSSVLVDPEDVDDKGSAVLSPVDPEERWQWIDWEDLQEDGGEQRSDEEDS